jgi:hypothetical protein
MGATDTVMPAGGGGSVDFTFAHPHAAKTASRNAAFAAKFDKKLRSCDLRRKFINSYPPGMLVASLTKMLFVFLFRTRHVFRTAAGSSNRRVQGLTCYKNSRKAHVSKYWKEPSSQVPPGHNLRTKVRMRCPSVSLLGAAGFVIGAVGAVCGLLPRGRPGAGVLTATKSPSTLP